MKLGFQFVVFVALFFALWLGLGSLHWVKMMHVKELTKEKQAQISGIILQSYRDEKVELKRDSIEAVVSGIKDKICLANGIDTSSIHVYVFVDDEINAFAIPGGQIIVNSSLISFCDNPEMLAGVLAHEIGHIQLNHITKKLAKDFGFGAIMVMTGTGKNLELIRKVLKTLSSTSFDRGQESDADAAGVHYLQKAGIDQKPMADFFKKMAKKAGNSDGALEWISTHPNSEERAEKIMSTMDTHRYTPLMDTASWNVFKGHIPGGVDIN